MNLHLSDVALGGSGGFAAIDAGRRDYSRDGDQFLRLPAAPHHLSHRLSVLVTLPVRRSFLMEVGVGLGELVREDSAAAQLGQALPLAAALSLLDLEVSVLVGLEVLDGDVDGVLGLGCWTPSPDQAPLLVLCLRSLVLTCIQLLSLLLQVYKAYFSIARRRGNAVPLLVLDAPLLRLTALLRTHRVEPAVQHLERLPVLLVRANEHVGGAVA